MEERDAVTLSARERQERLGIALTCMLGTLLFFMSFWLAYHQLTDLPSADLQGHLRFAKELTKVTVFRELLTGDDRMWHLLVKVLHWLGMSWNYAGAGATAAAITAAYAVFCALLRRELPHLNRLAVPVGALTLCLVGPIYMPWYSETIYRGQDSPNIWHSPTQIMVRPFALLAFYLTVRIYRRWRAAEGYPQRAYASRGEAALCTALITLSVWGKPCYFQVIVPALGVLLLIDLVRSRGKSFLFAVKMAAAYVPGALLTAMKFFESFFVESETSGIGMEIAPFAVWSHNSNSILISVLLLLAFPLFVILIDWKRFFRSVQGQLALLTLAMGAAMKALLAEIGSRRYHGNFGWGYIMAVVIVWFVTFCHFLDLMTGDRLTGRRYRVAAWVGWTLLALHLLSGIVYYCILASTNTMC